MPHSQSKLSGPKKTNPKYNIKKTRNDRIEKEVMKYKEELQKKQEEEKKKEDRMTKKRKMEQHWEMLRWLVQFMDENKYKWAEMKKERAREEEEKRKRKKREEWEMKTRDQKIKEMWEEEQRKKINRLSNKDERLAEAQRLKRSWMETRTKEVEEGGPLVGRSFPNLKPLAVLPQAGDPPIGKERWTLGVGPTPPPPKPLTVREEQGDTIRNRKKKRWSSYWAGADLSRLNV